jgi:hypothetical protein
MTSYEYKILSEDSKSDTATKLNELAADGWELVSSHPKSEGFFIIFMGFLSTTTTFVLRRSVSR